MICPNCKSSDEVDTCEIDHANETTVYCYCLCLTCDQAFKAIYKLDKIEKG